MQKNRLTIAVLTFNRSNYLKKMLYSIKYQTYPHFIVKIFDNASTDDTEKVIKPFLDDSRFFYFKHKINYGAGINYNIALKTCNTDFLIITHDDDIMYLNFVESVMDYMTQNPQTHLICTNAELIDEHENIIRKNHLEFLYRNSSLSPKKISITKDKVITSEKYDFIRCYIHDFNYIICPTILLKMDTIRKNALTIQTNVGKSADTYLFFQLNLLDGQIACLTDILYKYRLHTRQDSKNDAYMLPLLRNPVYKLLLSENINLAQDWLTYVTPICKQYIRAQIYKKNEYLFLKKLLLLENISDFPLRLLYYTITFNKSFYNFIKILRKYFTKFVVGIRMCLYGNINVIHVKRIVKKIKGSIYEENTDLGSRPLKRR